MSKFTDHDVVLKQHLHSVKSVSGKTQFIPMESYQYRERRSWPRAILLSIVDALALYGVYCLISEQMLRDWSFLGKYLP